MIYITEVSIEDGVLKKVICNNIQDDNSEEITIIVPESVKEIADDSFGANYNFRSVVRSLLRIFCKEGLSVIE